MSIKRGRGMLYYDRQDAGRKLAKELKRFKGMKETLVLGLARGGVVVAAEVAKELFLPLNVAAPRKIGAPGNPELALGSIMENGEGVFNHSIIRSLGISQSYIDKEVEKEKARAKHRLEMYRKCALEPVIKNQTVLLVDDGIATGSTMLACVKAMRKAGAKRVVVAAPVASCDSYLLMEEAADEVICPIVRDDFIGVGMYYSIFNQTEDEEVAQLLLASQSIMKIKAVQEVVHIPFGDIELEGELNIPSDALGIVLFAHGSGSSRFSPRNQFVASTLREKGFGTLLTDLLTEEEERIDEITREIRFDIDLLANRLLAITHWLKLDGRTKALRIGYFGSSTGAAAALIAAANARQDIFAAVSRGGRPDLADPYLSQVEAPTLLIVGGADLTVIELNKKAYDLLNCSKKFEIVPHATHLFEEVGALEKVAELAGAWFLKNLKIDQ